MIAARQIAFGKAAGGGLPTARDYIQDGLVAMWDGIENAGFGVHDAAATVWKDLVSGAEFDVGSRAFGDKSLMWSNTSTLTIEPDAIKGESFFTSDFTIMFNGTARCQTYNSVGLRGQSVVGFLQNGYGTAPNRYYDTNINCYNVGAWVMLKTDEDNGTFADVPHRTALVLNNSYVRPYYKGVPRLYNRKITIPTYSTGFTSFIWGGGSGCELHNILIYSRALTAEEIAYNYSIDKARFNLP